MPVNFEDDPSHPNAVRARELASALVTAAVLGDDVESVRWAYEEMAADMSLAGSTLQYAVRIATVAVAGWVTCRGHGRVDFDRDDETRRLLEEMFARLRYYDEPGRDSGAP